MGEVNNKKIYDETWKDWVDMKIYGAASMWLRWLVDKQIKFIKRSAKPKTILDVGCGEGTITNQLAVSFNSSDVSGIDFSSSGIKCANKAYKRNNLSFYYDLESKKLNKQYDLITAFEVLEHVDDWQDFLNKLSKSSKKYILLSFPTGRMRSFEVNVGHYRNYKKGEVEAYLRRKGFKPANIFYAGFPFYNPLYRELCNITNSGNNDFTLGKYSWRQKYLARFIWIFFVYFSSKRKFGNQFCGLFEKQKNNKFNTS